MRSLVIIQELIFLYVNIPIGAHAHCGDIIYKLTELSNNGNHVFTIAIKLYCLVEYINIQVHIILKVL